MFVLKLIDSGLKCVDNIYDSIINTEDNFACIWQKAAYLIRTYFKNMNLDL